MDLGAVVVGQQRFGARLISLLTTLREVGRLPVRTIQWRLRPLAQVHVSTGAIIAASGRVATRGASAVRQIRAAIRGRPHVHAAETGWRENGGNGYVWTFCTPTARFFVRRNRGKEVVDEVWGEEFAGVVVSDFSAAYHHYPGRKQRWWARLLREIHDLRRLYPADAALAQWARAVQRL